MFERVFLKGRRREITTHQEKQGADGHPADPPKPAGAEAQHLLHIAAKLGDACNQPGRERRITARGRGLPGPSERGAALKWLVRGSGHRSGLKAGQRDLSQNGISEQASSFYME